MCVLKRLSRLQVGTHLKNYGVFRNLSSLEFVISRNVVSVSNTSAVNFIVRWWFFACLMNCNIFSLFMVKSKICRLYIVSRSKCALAKSICFNLTFEDVSKRYWHLCAHGSAKYLEVVLNFPLKWNEFTSEN